MRKQTTSTKKAIARRLSVLGAALALAAGTVVLPAAPAFAANTSGSFNATCKPSVYTYGEGTSFTTSKAGNISVTISWTEANVTSVHADLKSSTGNTTGVLSFSNGQTRTWNNVAKGTYRVIARSATDVNCNSILPGLGNFKVTYSVTYP